MTRAPRFGLLLPVDDIGAARSIERWSTEVMPRCLAVAGRGLVTSPSIPTTGGR